MAIVNRFFRFRFNPLSYDLSDSCNIAYLLGTFPSALFLVRMVSGKDIRQSGTGNIGAMNSYDITRRKWVGIAVFILDALKAVFAVIIARILSNDDFAAAAIACVMVIIGHNLISSSGSVAAEGLPLRLVLFLLLTRLLSFSGFLPGWVPIM
jgi:glycerol-3-phosphate acyltransferase PlsY